MKKYIPIVLALALLLSLTACASTPKENSSGAITVTDMMGRTVTLNAPPERIVVVNAADCEILYAIGAGSAIAGRGEYCNYPEEANALPVVSSYEVDPEQVIALSPDLVIMGPMHKPDQNIPIFEQAGIPVIISAANRIEEVYTAIELIGAATGRQKEAEDLAASMKADLSDVTIRAKEANLGEKTVYFEVSPLEYGLWTAGKDTFMDEICGLLGFRNAFDDISGWSEVSEEEVIARDPDFIVTITMFDGEGQSPVDEILSRTGWQGMKAVLNKAVFNADADMTSRPGPRLATAAKDFLDFVLRTVHSEDAA